jgi:signal transduction histidine kinase
MSNSESTRDDAPAGPPAAAGSTGQGAAASNPGAGGRAQRGRAMFQRFAADVRSGARTSAPVIKETGARIGDWLARIGWGKFFLLAILALVFGGILSSALFKGSPAVIVERGPDPEVSVSVNVSPEGVRITPKRPAAPPKPPAPPAPPQASPPATPGETDAKGVVVDERGVRINAEQDGRKVTVLIDAKGVRIAERAATDGASAGAAEEGVVIDREATADPEKMAEAVEAARSKIEEIVSDQIREQVARRTRVYQEKSSDWFMSLIFLLIVAGIIIKIVLGSKRKAEVRAQAATATAAEEGLKRQLAEAQLKMMQAQVEPHFLFNTLASVDYLIETDPARASTMQKNLIQYLRAALPQMREGSTTLGKEVSLCRAYLEILRVRMEDRLQFAITVPQGLSSAQFPPMMLQSLIENAIKHGLEPKPEGGSLTLTANVSHGMLRVTVADTGLGFGIGTTPGTGVGLANVRERLAALYGSQARLTVEANTPSGTIATIEVPYVIDTVATAAANGGPVPQPA